MITLTARAAKEVRRMREAQGLGQRPLRLFVENGGCSGQQYGMSFDERKEGDTALECEGVQMLVDSASLAYLKDVSIDFDDGLQGKGFQIRNPNAKSTCGCGRSFN